MKMFKAIVLTGIAFSQCGVEAAVVKCGQQQSNSPVRRRRGGAQVTCIDGVLQMLAGIQRGLVKKIFSRSRAQPAESDDLSVVDMTAEVERNQADNNGLIATDIALASELDQLAVSSAMAVSVAFIPTVALIAVATDGAPSGEANVRAFAAYFGGTVVTLSFLSANPVVLPVVALMTLGWLNSGETEANQAYRIIAEMLRRCQTGETATLRDFFDHLQSQLQNLQNSVQPGSETGMNDFIDDLQSQLQNQLERVTGPMNSTPPVALTNGADHTEDFEK